MHAAKGGYYDVVEYLFLKKADIKQTNTEIFRFLQDVWVIFIIARVM